MAVLELGRRDAAADWGAFTGSMANQRAWKSDLFTPAESGFISQLGARMRRTGSNNSRVRLAIWADNDGSPGELLGYTDEFVVSASPTGTGQEHTANLTWTKAGVERGKPAAPIRLIANQPYWFGFKFYNAGVSIGYVPGEIPHRKIATGVSSMPSSPFGAAASAEQTKTPLIFALGTTNRLPVGTIDEPDGAIRSLAPRFEGLVSDADAGTPTWDGLGSFRIEVRKFGTTRLLWNYNKEADSTEITSFSVPYEGEALLPAETYQWRFQPRDQLGGTGTFTAWTTFSTAQVGSIDSSASIPTGREPDGIIGAFSGVWQHPDNIQMAGVKIRFLVDGQVAFTSGAFVPKTAAPNTTFSVSGAEIGFGSALNPLPPGVFTFQLQGQANDGGITAWSKPRAFSVNSPPDLPSDLTPVSGTRSSDRPRFRFLYTDPDLEDVPGVTVEARVEITRPDGVVTVYATNAIDPTTGYGYLEGDTSNMPLQGEYSWRVRATDGLAFGPWTAARSLTLLVAPIVKIDSPLEGASIPSSMPQINFSLNVSGISRYQIRMRRRGAAGAFYASPWENPAGAPSSATHQMEPGWLNNGSLYDVQAVVITTDNQEAVSRWVPFGVSFPSSENVQGVRADLVLNRRDWEPSSVAVTWLQGNTGAAWRGWVVYRRLESEPRQNAAPVAFITTPDQTNWIDHHPPPNESVVYSVTQLRREGDDIRESAPVEVPITTVLTTPVIASADNGGVVRVAVAKLSTGLAGGYSRNDAVVETWGTQGAPMLVRNPANHGAESLSLEFVLQADTRGTLQQHFNDVKQLIRSGDVVGVRLEHSQGWYRIVPGNWWQRGEIVGTIEISLELEEVYYDDSVDVKA